MNKILFALTATTALAAGAPAAAQYARGNVDARVDQLQTQLQAGVRSGAISRAEAMPLRDQLRQLNRLERQYSSGGLSGRERADLQRRTNSLRQQMRVAERTQPGRDRYGNDDRDDGRWGANDRDAYGRTDVAGRYDRDDNDRYDRDGTGRWASDKHDDRNADQDGRRRADAVGERHVADRGIVGQIVDRFTGSGLRVGQQAPASLYGVPMADRDRYRDGNGAYYRSDGRQIYQVDARTHLVAQVYPMSR